VKYAAIADWTTAKRYSVTFMCAQLGVVRQGYYRWLADGPCERERTDAELTEQIREIHTQLHGHPACAGSGPNSSSAACGSPASGCGA
jgi:putative transposase